MARKEASSIALSRLQLRAVAFTNVNRASTSDSGMHPSRSSAIPSCDPRKEHGVDISPSFSSTIINTLPTEVLHEIILLSCQRDIIIPKAFQFTASQVCRRWRWITHGSPLLWRDIHIIGEALEHCRHAQMFFERSSPLPVNLSLSNPPLAPTGVISPMGHIIQFYAPRIRRLTLERATLESSLHSIIEMVSIGHPRSPESHFHGPFSAQSMRGGVLSHLTLYDFHPSTASIISICTHLPQLSTLVLGVAHKWNSDPSVTCPRDRVGRDRQLHSSLQTLALDFLDCPPSCRCAQAGISYLNLQDVTHLEIRSINPQPAVFQGLEDSLSSLQTVVLWSFASIPLDKDGLTVFSHISTPLNVRILHSPTFTTYRTMCSAFSALGTLEYYLTTPAWELLTADPGPGLAFSQPSLIYLIPTMEWATLRSQEPQWSLSDLDGDIDELENEEEQSEAELSFTKTVNLIRFLTSPISGTRATCMVGERVCWFPGLLATVV